MLHLVFQFSGDTPILERIDTGDGVVFLDNAVLRILQDGNLANRLMPLLSNHRFYALADDLASGKVKPFQGPVNWADGSSWVPEGQAPKLIPDVWYTEKLIQGTQAYGK